MIKQSQLESVTPKFITKELETYFQALKLTKKACKMTKISKLLMTLEVGF